MSNNIIYNQQISVPFPFGVDRAFPLDSRSFFSDFNAATTAVRNAVRLEQDTETGNFILPGEGVGGVNSPYYYGQPVVVSEGDGSTATLYIVVKATDEHGEEYGTLVNVCDGLSTDCLTKTEAPEYIQAYIHEHLNTPCIDDYLFTGAVDVCGNLVPNDGLYAFGFKETDGIIQKCETATKVLSFDPKTPYDKNTNPIATIASVRNRIEALMSELDSLSEELDAHIANEKIHVPMTYNGTETPIEYLRIDGDKLTISAGGSVYSYRLQEWDEFADFYVLYGNVSMIDDVYYIHINGRTIPFEQATCADILSLARTSEEQNGYVVRIRKQEFNTNTYGILECDYSKKITDENVTAMFVISRTSGMNIPSMEFVASTNIIGDDITYNDGVIQGAENKNLFNTELYKEDLEINGKHYMLNTLYDPYSLAGNTFAISYQK